VLEEFLDAPNDYRKEGYPSGSTSA
jgi:hypothetical protein